MKSYTVFVAYQAEHLYGIRALQNDLEMLTRAPYRPYQVVLSDVPHILQLAEHDLDLELDGQQPIR